MNQTEPHNIALLLAGGLGSRLSDKCPKQFIEIDGESVLLHTMRAFQQHPDVTDIHVVCLPRWQEYVEGQARRGTITKFRGTLPAGQTAYQSICHGIEGLLQTYREQNEKDIVLVHDAVRPLISYEIISRNIQVCRTQGNAITGLWSNEAYLCTTDGQESGNYIQREHLMRAQTPHTFPLTELRRILAIAREQGIEEHQSLFTLCNEIHYHPLHIAQGDILNFKLTDPGDIKIYQALKGLVI